MGVKITCGNVTVGRFVNDKITLPCNLHYMANDLVIENIPPTEGLNYTLSDDGTYYICGDNRSNNVADVEIAGSIDNIPVTTIVEQAFYDCGKLTSVAIGNSVTTIGRMAFENCDKLTSVTIGNSVMTIGERAFYNCWGLTSVVIGNGVTTIGNSAFSKCHNLTSIVIPDSVTTIEWEAFGGCKSLIDIKFNGTISEWNNVVKVQRWCADAPATHVQCTDGTVAL